MKVTYIDHMGTDLSVVNAARVSFAKKSEGKTDWVSISPDQSHKVVSMTVPTVSDVALIKYLAKHNHWTPFGHTAVTLHVKAPLFVARQLGKHQVGLVWNEVSRRYVTDTPEFFVPDMWRQAAENVKQGSSTEEVVLPMSLAYEAQEYADQALSFYEDLLEAGVCPEQARMILPQSMYTEWYWTGSIAAFSRVCKLRLDSHTQRETQEVAQQISDIIELRFPVSWRALQC